MSAMPAARETELGSLPPPGALAAMASVKSTAPRLARSCGSAFRVSRTAPMSLSCRSASHSASSTVSSSRPARRGRRCGRRRRSGPSAPRRRRRNLEVGRSRHVGPLGQHVTARVLELGRAERSRSSSRPQTATAAPSSTRPSASARPSPSVPPVTTKTFSARFELHLMPPCRTPPSAKAVARNASRLALRSQPHEAEPGPPRIRLRREVTPSVLAVVGRRPGDDRLLGVRRPQVGVGLLVPVPQLLAGDHPAHGAPDHLRASPWRKAGRTTRRCRPCPTRCRAPTE